MICMKGGIVIGMPSTPMEDYAAETRNEAVEETKKDTQEDK